PVGGTSLAVAAEHAICHDFVARAAYHRGMDGRDDGLWRISDFERQRANSAVATTLLPTTLLADLRRLRPLADGGQDVMAVAAACVRHREPALLYLGCGRLVWPV